MRATGSASRAHPRSRGENWSLRPSHLWIWGSSPLTRGKLHVGHLLTWYLGLIPAHAGKTGSAAHSCAALRAHPRSRGENKRAAMTTIGSLGSSPLTRGKRGELLPSGGGGGLIPAHAGKTPFADVMSITNRAHPRSRGENVGDPPSNPGLPGSSPLTRGKRRWGDRNPPPGGLIPAHAGKTCASICMGVGIRAHPRSRGENVLRGDENLGGHGSSPLTRGKRTSGRSVRRSRGLIPAHAGKT